MAKTVNLINTIANLAGSNEPVDGRMYKILDAVPDAIRILDE